MKLTNLPENTMAKKLDLPDPQLDDRMQTFIEHGSGTDVKENNNPLNKDVKESLFKGEETKRLVVDIPASLHRRIKLHCAAEGYKMNVFIRDAAVASLEDRHA